MVETKKLKPNLALPYFNRAQPSYCPPDLGWTGWFGVDLESTHSVSWVLMDRIMLDENFNLVGCGWTTSLSPILTNLEKCRLRESEWAREGIHYWLNRAVQLWGIAIYSSIWQKTFAASRGTELTKPYGQRIEPPDNKRVMAADKAASQAEANWLKTIPQ